MKTDLSRPTGQEPGRQLAEHPSPALRAPSPLLGGGERDGVRGACPSGSGAQIPSVEGSWNLSRTTETLLLGLGLIFLAAPAAVAESTLVSQPAEAAFEGLFASDVRVLLTDLAYGQKHGRWEANVGVSYTAYELDYRPAPFDFLGQDRDVSAHRIGAQMSGQRKVGEDFLLLAAAGAYTGFGNFRSVWFDEYFHQQFATLPGYRLADPHGFNASGGLRWEYLPASGFAEGTFGGLHDQIAPGYEIDFAGLRRARSDLNTLAWQLAFENVLTPWLRVRHEFRLTDVTDRDPRLAYHGSVAAAAGDRWLLRLSGGYTQEEPTFRARHAGAAIEFTLAPGWTWIASGRHYRDTGEIENSLFTTATPGLTAWQAGFGLRRTWGDHTVRLSVTPYFTQHEPFGIGTAFFQNLFRDRTWVLVQCAYAAEF